MQADAIPSGRFFAARWNFDLHANFVNAADDLRRRDKIDSFVHLHQELQRPRSWLQRIRRNCKASSVLYHHKVAKRLRHFHHSRICRHIPFFP